MSSKINKKTIKALKTKEYNDDQIVTVGYLNNVFKAQFKAELKAEIRTELFPDLKNEINTDLKLYFKQELDKFRVEFKEELKSELKSELKVELVEYMRPMWCEDMERMLAPIKDELRGIKSILMHILKYIEVNEEDKVVVNKRLERLEMKCFPA
jgi:hypothetical protein